MEDISRDIGSCRTISCSDVRLLDYDSPGQDQGLSSAEVSQVSSLGGCLTGYFFTG